MASSRTVTLYYQSGTQEFLQNFIHPILNYVDCKIIQQYIICTKKSQLINIISIRENSQFTLHFVKFLEP